MPKTHVALDLQHAGRTALAEAVQTPSGRAAHALTPGRGATLTQTILALRGGASLAEHTAPGPATLQVLLGAAHLEADGTVIPLRTGDWVTIPATEHTLHAAEDFVGLLTVAAG